MVVLVHGEVQTRVSSGAVMWPSLWRPSAGSCWDRALIFFIKHIDLLCVTEHSAFCVEAITCCRTDVSRSGVFITPILLRDHLRHQDHSQHWFDVSSHENFGFSPTTKFSIEENTTVSGMTFLLLNRNATCRPVPSFTFKAKFPSSCRCDALFSTLPHKKINIFP